MAKSVMISINTEWVYQILNHRKTVEVRKTIPKLKTPFKCYIYCTKDGKEPLSYADYCGYDMTDYSEDFLANGKVVAEFVCDRINPIPIYDGMMVDVVDLTTTRLTIKELVEYAGGKKLYGWHISDLKVYDKPKELREFCKCGALSPEELDESLCDYCSTTDYGKTKCSSSPNGAIFCEGRWCDAAYEEYLDEFTLTRPPQSWCYVEDSQ